MDMNRMTRAIRSILRSEKGTQPYDSVADVKRVDGGTAWVHIPGGVDETPVKLTMYAAAGDKVMVRVAGGRAWLTGNATAPPTDDKKANKALDAVQGAAKRLGMIEQDASGLKIKVRENEQNTEIAMETANGKNTVYHASQEPSGGTYKTGDIWFDAANGFAMHKWDGSAWMKEEFGSEAIEDASITNAKIANAAINDAKISTVDVGKLTGGYIDAGHINAAALIIGAMTLQEVLNGKASNASVAEAAKTASKYITAIDGNGVTVHAENNPSTNYSRVNANGMQVVKGGEEVASFGDLPVIGKTSGTNCNTRVDPSAGMGFYRGSVKYAEIFCNSDPVGTDTGSGMGMESKSSDGTRQAYIGVGSKSAVTLATRNTNTGAYAYVDLRNGTIDFINNNGQIRFNGSKYIDCNDLIKRKTGSKTVSLNAGDGSTMEVPIGAIPDYTMVGVASISNNHPHACQLGQFATNISDNKVTVTIKNRSGDNLPSVTVTVTAWYIKSGAYGGTV